MCFFFWEAAGNLSRPPMWVSYGVGYEGAAATGGQPMHLARAF